MTTAEETRLAYVSAMWTAGLPATESGYLEYLELLTNDFKNGE